MNKMGTVMSRRRAEGSESVNMTPASQPVSQPASQPVTRQKLGLEGNERKRLRVAWKEQEQDWDLTRT